MSVFTHAPVHTPQLKNMCMFCTIIQSRGMYCTLIYSVYLYTHTDRIRQILTPFIGNLTALQSVFSFYHSSLRMAVECSFGKFPPGSILWIPLVVTHSLSSNFGRGADSLSFFDTRPFGFLSSLPAFVCVHMGQGF